MRSASTRRGDELVVPNEISTAGAHGFFSTEPKMNAIFVAAGAGIKRGAKLSTIDNIDVAPTIARMLGVTLEHASGHVLDEILGETQSEETPASSQSDRDGCRQTDEVRRAACSMSRDPRASAKATIPPAIAPQRWPSQETCEPIRGMTPITRTLP